MAESCHQGRASGQGRPSFRIRMYTESQFPKKEKINKESDRTDRGNAKRNSRPKAPRIRLLLALLLLLKHTDPHSTARTSIPLSAPPAYTPPAPLGLAPSPPLPSTTRMLRQRNASAEPPSYSPAPFPASLQEDIQQHAHAHIPTCAPRARTTARHAEPEVSAHALWPPARIHSESTVHRPSPVDERAHTRPCRSCLECRMRERAAAVKGCRQNRKQERKKGQGERTRAASLLFLPTDAQPAPEQLRQHFKRTHCDTRDGDAHAPDTDVRVVTIPASDTRIADLGASFCRIKQRSGRREYAGQSQKGKSAVKSAEASMTSVQRAACRAIRICPTEKAPPSPKSRKEARTAGQTSPPRSHPNACASPAAKSVVMHKEASVISPPVDSSSPGNGIQQRTSGKAWPVLCAGDADCHGHRTWLHVERGEREKEEGEGLKSLRRFPTRDVQKSLEANLGEGSPGREIKKSKNKVDGEGVDALHHATTDNAMQQRLRLEEREDDVHRGGQGPASCTFSARSRGATSCVDGSALLRSRASTISMHYASWISSQPRQWIGRWTGNAVEDGREKEEYIYAPQKPTIWRDA
ncbi:hypothetical protein B0H13DRAFT_2275217 [Mycena leptocephala]|nr:hypothetical protein B0H13DRAFT_2275217 [Mycena leptocephala]